MTLATERLDLIAVAAAQRDALIAEVHPVTVRAQRPADGSALLAFPLPKLRTPQ